MEYVKKLNDELYSDFFSYIDGKYYFLQHALDVEEPTPYKLKKAAKKHIKPLIGLMSVYDILDIIDEDDFLEEIGEENCKRYFRMRYLEDYTTKELLNQLNYDILPINTIDDELKIKHLLSIWSKYTYQDLERLL